MSVYYCIPSKKPTAAAQECVDKWRARGYRVALWRDSGDAPVDCDLLLVGAYPGYAAAVNALCLEVLEGWPEVEWLVTGGDDIEPDQYHSPEEIARECSEHFHGTFGVMQPTKDGRGIETICGSPWMGAEFCRRMYGGNGPLFAGYHHNFVDNELQEVAVRMGVLWQRPDLCQKHNNWMWTTKVRPAFLDKAYSQPEWDKAQGLFFSRRAQNFPGHEPLSPPCFAEENSSAGLIVA